MDSSSRFASCCSVVLLACACGGTSANAKSVGTLEAEQALEPVSGNPFAGVDIFHPPYTNADQARRRLEATNPEEAKLIAKIADTPQARWLGEWSGEIETVAGNYVKAAHNKGKVALLVAYNVPNRDCGSYSSGGAGGAEQYRKWIEGLAAGIGPRRRAIVVLEPDALGHLDDCLSEQDQAERLSLLKYAVETLEAQPGVSVYVDAGHSRWVEAEQMTRRLELAGVKQARGFALNVSNYVADEELIAYGRRIASALGGAHFIIDSSRNGNGPPESAEGEASWCNPPARALGKRPSTETEDDLLDAYAWIKNPGESDGTCGGGPEAGQWFHERALELARNASW